MEVMIPTRSVLESIVEHEKEVKEFDESKAGVKGVVDSGIVKVPRMFIHPPEKLQFSSLPDNKASSLHVPVIDFTGVESGRRMEIVKEVGDAAETWGFFQIVNHGIPVGVMGELLEATRRFHEQSSELKMELYSRDYKQRVKFFSNIYLHASVPASWRDFILFDFKDEQPDFESFPQVCREAVREYMTCTMRVKETLSECLSEALGLSGDYFGRMEYMKSQALGCLYYPVCPEPNLTIGTPKHSDPTFLTILLQDSIGGLQVRHQDCWVDVHHEHGALLANIGDLMQLVSNDRFKSVEHRVLAKQVGPRLSAALFLVPSKSMQSKPIGPAKEILSDYNPPVYRDTSHHEYAAYYASKRLDGTSALPHFKL